MKDPIYLKYESFVSGETSMSIPTENHPEDQTLIVIEGLKNVVIYPGGVVVYSEPVDHGMKVRSNYPIKKKEDGTFEIVVK